MTLTRWRDTSSRYQSGSAAANASPTGGSTLITSAPNAASRAAASGPGRFVAMEMMRTPLSGSFIPSSLIDQLYNILYDWSMRNLGMPAMKKTVQSSANGDL